MLLKYCDSGLQNLSAYTHSNKNDDAVIITTVSCSLSMLGAIGIFWTFYKIPETRNFVRRLMIWLTVADFLTASGYIVAAFRHFFVQKDKTSCALCIIQSYVTTYSSLVSFFFTMIIALHIFLTIYNRRPITGTKRYMYLFNGISWGIPGAIVTAALFCNQLGQDITPFATSHTGTGPWCWIQVDRSTTANSTDNSTVTGPLSHETIIWMTVTGKGWEILCYLVTTSLYVLMKLHLYLKYQNHEYQKIDDSLRHEDRNYFFVFLVLYCIRIWGTVRFFMNTADESYAQSKASETLENIQAFGDPSQAFFNFCLFCLFDGTVRRKMLPCFYPNSDETVPLLDNDGSRYGDDNGNWPIDASGSFNAGSQNSSVASENPSFHSYAGSINKEQPESVQSNRTSSSSTYKSASTNTSPV